MFHRNFFVDALITFSIFLTGSTLLGLIFNNGSIGEIIIDRIIYAALFAIVWTILHFAINRT